MLKDALTKAASKSPWASWLIEEDSEVARTTLDFLNTCLANITRKKHSRILKKLAGDESEVEATIHELVTHELLQRLGLSPEYEPEVAGQTPDLRFVVEGKTFLADVFVTHSPSKTLRDYADGTGEAWDTSKPSESRTHKIASTIGEKATKYKCLNIPLVIFVFLGDHRALDAADVEKALFGMTAYEVSLEDHYPIGIRPERVPIGGILLPDEEGYFRYPNLSAVVCCDWFDTLNRSDRGKRLHCLVLHNWSGVKLAESAFQLFPQIVWRPGAWKPEQTLQANIASKFTSDGGLECHEYTAHEPW